MVVGSDRVREFDTIIKKYNDVKSRHGYYNFDKINIVSAAKETPMLIMYQVCQQVK